MSKNKEYVLQFISALVLYVIRILGLVLIYNMFLIPLGFPQLTIIGFIGLMFVTQISNIDITSLRQNS